MKNRASKKIQGIGLSPGIAIGTACRVEPQSPTFYRIKITPEVRETELKRFRQALEKSRQQLQSAKEKLEAQVGKEHAHIIDAHLFILEDRYLVEEVERRIQQDLQSPERAVREEVENWLSAYRSLNDPFFRERGSDLEEVAERIVANLMELDPRREEELPEDLILVASEVSLFVLAQYPLERVKALVLRKAGRTSHAVIVARSYQIPVVSGILNVEKRIRTGDNLIVDGTTGLVRVCPTGSEIAACQARIEQEKAQRQVQLARAEDQLPCITADGRRIFLYANIEIDREVRAGMKFGAEGVGLFRSEYVYMRDKEGPVGEEEQWQIYRELAEEVGEKPAIIRTLDFGDEHHPYFSSITGEGSSTLLGLRGIRLSLQYPEIYKSQIRAILRANLRGNLKIVLPMISDVDEVIEGRRLIREAQKEVSAERPELAEDIEVGVMVEVPAAIIMLETIAAHADFFAVGTNDLVQYTLAAGRADARIAYLFNPLHPAVLKSLYRVACVAKEHGSVALVCGEMASHPTYASLLVGMGFQYLSMNPFAIPEIKQILRQISFVEAQEVVKDALQLATHREVEHFVNDRLRSVEAVGG